MSSTPKKYLSLEEAAERLGMSNDQLVRLREDGEIRGFADRGTWKFRVEDVDELVRSRQADSNPDVPMLEDEEPLPVGEDMSATVLSDPQAGDDVGEQPTEIRRSEESEGSSDSDVKLVGADSDSDITLAPADDPAASDSDVKLVTEPLDMGSDSDVKLVSEPISEGSDSDVQLIEPSQSGDDGSDSDVALVGGDSSDDSGIALDLAPDDSEQASVLSDDVGMALETGSSLTLAADSGISLEADEGITLDSASDSGISLDTVGDSGISLEDSGEVAGTVPMMDAVPDVEGVEETKFEIPAMEGDSSFELEMEDDSGDDTGVLDLEDSGEVLDDAIFDLDEDDSGYDDDELEVAPEILGEDDELEDLDIFDADEGLFEESGASQEFAAPVGREVEVEADWGAGTVAALAFSTTLIVLATVVSFDLVQSMWSAEGGATPIGSMLLGLFGG